MTTQIRITTGTYNTSDFRIVKEYRSEKAAFKFLKTIGYKFDKIDQGDSWSYQGKNYKISIG